MARRRHTQYAKVHADNLENVFDPVRRLPDAVQEILDPWDEDVDFIVAAIENMRFVGFDMEDPENLRLAVGAAKRKSQMWAEERASGEWDRQRQEARAEEEERSAFYEVRYRVYYARIGNRVKIGYTSDLKRRMQSIMPEELTTERGGIRKEGERHRQFAALRTSGEWFRFEGPLVEHIEALQAQQAAA